MKSQLNLLFIIFVAAFVFACAPTPKNVYIEKDGMSESLRIADGAHYDDVIRELCDRGIDYVDVGSSGNPFLSLEPGESKAIVVRFNSHDENGDINGEISYRVSFDEAGKFIRSERSIALDKNAMFQNIE